MTNSISISNNQYAYACYLYMPHHNFAIDFTCFPISTIKNHFISFQMFHCVTKNVCSSISLSTSPSLAYSSTESIISVNIPKTDSIRICSGYQGGWGIRWKTSSNWLKHSPYFQISYFIANSFNLFTHILNHIFNAHVDCIYSLFNMFFWGKKIKKKKNSKSKQKEVSFIWRP